MNFIGYHVSKIFKPSKPLEINMEEYRARVFDALSVQIFIAGPREMKMRLRDEDIDRLGAYIAGRRAAGDDLFVVAHATYLDHPWETGKVFFIKTQMEACSRMGINFLIHLSNHSKERVAEVLSTIEEVREGHRCKLFLETPAMKPSNSVYSHASKLCELYLFLKERGLHIGICIDTAHIFSCGVDIRGYAEAKAFFDEILASIPPSDLMLHLNDNANPLGGGKDKHELLCRGQIWGFFSDEQKREASGLYAIFEAIDKHSIRAILEIDSSEGLIYDRSIISTFPWKSLSHEVPTGHSRA